MCKNNNQDTLHSLKKKTKKTKLDKLNTDKVYPDTTLMEIYFVR